MGERRFLVEALTGRDSQKPYLSALRAAKAYGQRPTAMIFHDPYFGHRKWWNEWLRGERWVPEHDSKDWTWQDYLLADALQVIEDFTDSESGQLMWHDQSPDVWWNVEKKVSGANEALERYRKNNGELGLGESIYAVPEFRDPDNKPTMRQWLERMEAGITDRRPDDRRDARPPTPEELRKLQEKLRAQQQTE